MSQQQEELSVNLAIRVAPSMLEQLRAVAAEDDRPVGWLVRRYIATGLSVRAGQRLESAERKPA